MKKKKVLAAMSGGVDSAVAALLLVKAGFDVAGVTYKLWQGSGEGKTCCGAEAAHSARRAAEKIGIPHYVLNFRREFENRVVNLFSREYFLGRTPNPCVECNRSIKFGLLLRRADELGADYIATGHYARIEEEGGVFTLRRGADPLKDQSYFLYPAVQSSLERILMPLGNYRKEEVRRTALEEGLPNADRPESQEICFVEDGDYREFLKKLAPHKFIPGKIIGMDGEILGAHAGIANYTIGQRRGLGVNRGRPLYVIAFEQNNVIVGEEKHLYSRGCSVRNMYFAAGRIPVSFTAGVKLRHPGKIIPAEIAREEDPGAVRIRFREPQRAVAPGQSAVIYRDEAVVGGGIVAGPDGP